MKLLWSLPLLLALGGCVTTDGPGSVSGTCGVFEAPRYAVKGARPYDQDWIDSTIEGGVGACKWARPAPRPPELERKEPRAVAKPPKKPKPLWLRMLHQWPTKPAAPVVAAPAPPPPPEQPAPVAPPPPRSAIDELLHPLPAPDGR